MQGENVDTELFRLVAWPKSVMHYLSPQAELSPAQRPGGGVVGYAASVDGGHGEVAIVAVAVAVVLVAAAVAATSLIGTKTSLRPIIQSPVNEPSLI